MPPTTEPSHQERLRQASNDSVFSGHAAAQTFG